MRRGSAVRSVAGAVALLLAPAIIGAQGLRTSPPTGQLGVSFDGSWSSHDGTSGTRTSQFAEWLDIGVAGSVADPRVFSFSLQLRPAWIQLSGRQPFDTAPSNDATRLTNYAVSATAFSILPVSGSMWLNRSSGRRPGLFGSSSASDIGRVGAAVRLRNPPLPVTFEIERIVRVDSLFQPAGNALTRNDVLTQVGGRARNSKLDVGLRHESYEDRQGQNDQSSLLGDLSHRFTWGKGSSISSSLYVISRSGFSPLEQTRWDERIRLQHTRNVLTDWQYGQFSNDVVGSRNSGRNVSSTMTAVLRPDLRAGLAGRGIWSTFPTGTRSEFRAFPRIALSRRTAGGVVVGLQVGVGYEWLRQETANGGILVVDERHVVDLTGRFRLEQAFVDTATVIVTDVAQTMVYQADADYRVVVTGQVTEILVLPPGRIVVGDTVLVDYQYRVGGSGRATGLLSSLGASVSWRPIQLYAFRDRRSPRTVEGQAFFLRYDYLTAGVSAGGRVGWLSASGRAEYQQRQDDVSDVEVQVLSGTLSAPLARSLTGSLVAALSHQQGDMRLDNFRSDVSLGWTPSGYLRVGVRGTVWSWRQTGVRREDFLGGGADVEWRMGQMLARVAYSRGRWENGSDNVQDFLYFGLVRAF